MNRIHREEGLRLLKEASLFDLGEQADAMRKVLHSDGIVTFVIDRNIN
ncbi:MAG: dehypoxanthine futalosine cyclase, partial [Nitrospirae bacterium]|nr:dehypoxanthine futalosine cyclase [Nitrospirota bacterium]